VVGRTLFMKILKRLKSKIYYLRKYGIRFYFDKEYKEEVYRSIRREQDRRRSKKHRLGSFRANKKKRKLALFKRDGNKCHWCNTKMKFKEATVDHIVELSKGGSHHLKNLRLMHLDCHKIRHKTGCV
jgi:5-methylcytosine-specific restriction endonuclease McrA